METKHTQEQPMRQSDLGVVLSKAIEQRDELAAALRDLIAAEDEYGDEANVAVNQALEPARAALAKLQS